MAIINKEDNMTVIKRDGKVEDLEPKKIDWYKNNAFYLMTATSADPHTTADWIRQVKEAFPGIPVLSDYLSLGVCCHTGPGALGIGVSVKPV